MAAGTTTSTEVKSKDGSTISVINRPMNDGGWVATHEDITERRAQNANAISMQERAAARRNRRRDRAFPPPRRRVT